MNPSLIVEGLNDQQRQAVMTTEGPLLIVAGPGTGKTLTIVRRIAHLVHTGVEPENVLAVTFTNRAAREMKERTEALLGAPASRMFIGTFHLLGLRIIREQGRDITLCNRDEQLSLVKTLVKGTAKAVQQTAERISRIKNCLENAGDLKEVLDAYQAALAGRRACDFDDLILLPVDLLQNETLRKTYRNRFNYIIADEYQDINPAQYRLLRLLAGEAGNVCAVGDSDQSIYSFRGADLSNFLNFEKDFVSAARITLSQNYRSSAVILEASDCVIRNNRQRIAKTVRASGDGGAQVAQFSVPDERSEADAIIGEIEARMGGMDHEGARLAGSRESSGEAYRFSDFAVIYRTNAQARVLEEAFAASGIPFQTIGKRGSAQKREIEETLAFLRSLALSGTSAEAERDNGDGAEAALLGESDFFDPRADAVALMTMHMAKGLEFRVVFIAGCEDGLTPCTVMKDGVDIEEERRLFYVGMTRAKEELFLVQARNRFLYGQRLGQRHSPFLDEIPAECKKSSTIADKIRKQKPEEKQMGLF